MIETGQAATVGVFGGLFQAGFGAAGQGAVERDVD
jgi:hypothetical protein